MVPGLEPESTCYGLDSVASSPEEQGRTTDKSLSTADAGMNLEEPRDTNPAPSVTHPEVAVPSPTPNTCKNPTFSPDTLQRIDQELAHRDRLLQWETQRRVRKKSVSQRADLWDAYRAEAK